MCKSDDLISRQAAIDAVKRISLGETDVARLAMRIEDYLIRLSSTQPERKKGKWNPFDVPWYQCSVCGAVREQKAFMENFCPNCGADMRGEQDG